MKVFLCSLLLLLFGCAVGGFDVTQPWITINSEPPEMVKDEVHWKAYEKFPPLHSGCHFFYLRSVRCPECDRMDETFYDSMTTAILDEYFTAYKITNDSPNWEKVIIELGVHDVPIIIIINTSPYERIFEHKGYLDSSDLNVVLNIAAEKCL